ncbi:beta-Ig-H3/Fasciclin [Pyricularia oryzae 70-15]|uniref:Beta-Ig-H3/Fasciclin n=4 Tax=Pyricularia oryzae TaxID=318829 RepID=G5EHM3_PYRO7|nr:beta-Ig-H3/Fasciclin [Pyricularia oryzae 70-15]ACM48569.1 MFP1 [Pyricularia oryzae]EAQ71238.1 hypothetical protein MGCH7_ch7g645 [Pyricularia oryzae 70-15]EHA46103.1 beta-Ig-H3/Fasciclin [Pyricularia oryzae 70-15]KAI7920118.1 fasciclin domain-containing protein [Pyricularia oryzae]KAI7922954.1 fasciclin domain-containing protein [Pyricularia oryzae]
MKFTITVSALFAACAAAQSLTEVLSKHESVSALNNLLSTQPALVSTLGSAKNITILAPNNEAITALTSDSANAAAIQKDSGLVPAILSYHVINGTYRGDAFTKEAKFLPTLLTNATYAQVMGGQKVEGKAAGQTVEFKSGLQKMSKVTEANIAFDGGVIHVIDSVLTLPPAAAPALTKLDLKSLAESLTKANLVKTVEELKDVTIFAPADSAFAKLSSTSSTLSVEQLSAVLTYHVVNGTVAYSTDLKDGQKVKTVNGQEVTVRIKNGEVMVGNAKVVTPDVLISNGVVHVIDNVLMPGGATTSQGSVSSGGAAARPSSPPASEGHFLTRPGSASFVVLMVGVAIITGL